MFNFDSWSAWTWVIVAWAELILAYAGYSFYLHRRLKRLEQLKEEVSSHANASLHASE
jgi:HAMP domain-containing protein